MMHLYRSRHPGLPVTHRLIFPARLQDSSDDENLPPFPGCIPDFRWSRSPRQWPLSTPRACCNTTSCSPVCSGLERPGNLSVSHERNWSLSPLLHHSPRRHRCNCSNTHCRLPARHRHRSLEPKPHRPTPSRSSHHTKPRGAAPTSSTACTELRKAAPTATTSCAEPLIVVRDQLALLIETGVTTGAVIANRNEPSCTAPASAICRSFTSRDNRCVIPKSPWFYNCYTEPHYYKQGV